MASVLVTGANRGIGLGLVRQLLADPSVATVIATARNVNSGKDLEALNSPKLCTIQLEVESEESIAQAFEAVSKIVGEKGLDILINNAGIDHRAPLNGQLSKADILEQFDVNTVAPLLIANKFYPLLKKAALNKGSAQIANISSVLGSLDFAPNMPNFLQLSVYASTKSALNMLTRRLAVEWKDDNIRATSICPGWVKTDKGGPAAELTVDESTIPLVKTILSLTDAHNGNYYNRHGEPIAW